MTDKDSGDRGYAQREAGTNEDEANSSQEPKRKFNGQGPNGSWNEEEPGRPRWTKDTTLVAEYEYERADRSHAYFICKGLRPDRKKVFKTQRLNCASFGDRLNPEDKVDRFPGEALANDLGDVRLVIIDPVTAYMGRPGKIDSYRVTDVRSLLMPLQEMAARLNVAVIAINHLTKSGSAEALMRFLGSVGMVAAGRAAFLVAKDPAQPERRLLLPAKNNLGDDRTGFAFRILEKPTGYDQPAYAIAVDWEAEHVTNDR